MANTKQAANGGKVVVRLQLYVEEDGRRVIAGPRLLKGDTAPGIEFSFDPSKTADANEAAKRLQKHLNEKTK